MPDLWMTNQLEPLHVSGNSRYFINRSGKVVWLGGSNYWYAIQDGDRSLPASEFDFDSFVSFLVTRNMNYTKAHVWNHSWHISSTLDWYITPQIYQRTGPGNALDGYLKFDLTKFNEEYFIRLRQRCIQYGNNGIYVAVEFFDRFDVYNGTTMSGQWSGCPFNANNNINSINGDPDSHGHGLDVLTLYISAVTSLQEDYCDHLIDWLNDLDNIIWEIAMEPRGEYVSNGSDYPEDWVDYFISYVQTYEASKPKQHPILQGAFSPHDTGDNTYLLGCGADVISPEAGTTIEYDHGCAYQNGTKVLLLDTDHIDWTEEYTEQWSWKAFTRGAGGFAIMDGGYSDYDDQGGGQVFANMENSRYNLGYIRDVVALADVRNTLPQNGGTSPCDTGYCLYPASSSYHEYVLFQPSDSSATLDLSSESGTFDIRKTNLADGTIDNNQTTTGGASRSITQPSGWTSGWAAWVRPQ